MDNYAEETQPLFKLLRTPAFRFVVVRFNHYSLVRRLQSDFREQFPDRVVSTINTEKATYEEILETYLEQKEGFLFLENFEDILKRDADSQGKVTPEMAKNNKRRSSIAAGLNMRRDKLAKSPIAIIAFVFASAGELYARSLMEKMPDMWSFRSLLLNLKWEQKEQEVLMTDFLQMQPTLEPMSGSTIGGSSQEEKLAELDRLLAQVNETPETEINYLRNLYGQIAKLQEETGQYEESIKTIDYLIENATDIDRRFWLLIDKGDLFRKTGILEEAFNTFNKAKELADVNENKFQKGQALQRLGNVCTDLGDLSDALIQYEEALSIFQKLYNITPNDKTFKNGLAVTFSKLGQTHASLGDLNKALHYFEGRTRLGIELYEADKKNMGFKKGLAISYSKLADIYASLGDLDKALHYYEKDLLLTKELYEADKKNVGFKNGLAVLYSKLGKTHTSLGNLDKALHYFEERVRLAKELYEADKKNVGFKNGLAISYSKLGDIHASLGDLDKALHFFEDETILFKELYVLDKKNVGFKNGLAISYSKLGDTHASLGDLDKALHYFEIFTTLMKELFEVDKKNVDFKNGLAISYYKLGNFHKENIKDTKTAKTYFQEAKQLWNELIATSPNFSKFKKNLEKVQKELASLSD
jgi:tetratricopeptide (TPR) repeat protein